MNKKNNIRFLSRFSLLLAIEIIVCFTPLGSLPAMGPIVITLSMIPVILTAILLGTKAGALMGAFTGVFRLLIWTLAPPSPLVAFVFSPFYSLGEFYGNGGSIIISILPRILTGVVAGILFKSVTKRTSYKMTTAYIIASIGGSLTNTFGVMVGIWLFFGNQYSLLFGSSMIVIIMGTVLTNGLPEALISAVISVAIGKTLKKK